LATIEEDMKILEVKMNQLKLDYERFFLGTRPREPVVLRGEVEKLITIYSNQAIQNTSLRFRFSSLCSRYQAYKRRWNETMRRMADGSYARHQFKAQLHESRPGRRGAEESGAAGKDELYEAYVEARRSCGQSVGGLSPEKLEKTIAKQRASLRERFGGTEFKFRVVVEDGKAKLKASRVKKSASA
jgi:hypothetical protein